MTGKPEGQQIASGGLAAAILDSAHALVITIDVEGRIAGFNRACELLSGYEANEVIGTHIWDRLLPEEAIEPIRQLFANLRAGGEIPEEYENAWVTRDGCRPIIAWNNSIVRDAAGDIEVIVGIGVDITERRKTADRLAMTANDLATAQRLAGIGSWRQTVATREEEWSDQFYRNLGLEPGSCPPSIEKFYEHVHPDDHQTVKETVRRSIQEKQPYSMDFRVIWPDGTERLVHEEAEVVLDEAGKPVALTGTMQDVTKLREKENRLRRLTQSFANAQRIAQTGNWDWDAVAKVEWWSDEVYRIMGLEPGPVASSYDGFMERIHPDDREKVEDAIDAAENSLQSYDVIFRIVRPDGEERVVRETGECTLDANGCRAGLTGTVQDITEQHAARQALTETAGRLEGAMRLTKLGSWEWDPDSNLLKMSEETLRICGLGPEHAEVDNDFLMAMVPAEEHAGILRMMDGTISDRGAYTNEYHIVRPDGDRRTVLEHGEAFHDATTGQIRLVGTIQDITERQRAEEELARTLKRLADAQTAAQIGNWEWDAATDQDWWSEQQFRNYGIEAPAGFVPSENYLQFAHPADREAARQAVERSVKTGTPLDMEFRAIGADGVERTLWVHGVTEANADGRVIRTVGTTQDVTVRKRAEQKLALTTERLEEAQRIGHIGHWEWRSGSKDTVWSDEMYRIFGMEPGAIHPTHDNFFSMVHEDHRESIATMMADTIESGQAYETEFRITRADGAMRHVFERGERYIDEQTGEWNVRGIMQDITERKAAEEKLRKTAENLKETQRIAKLGSWVWDIEEDKEWWSDEIYRIVGWEIGSAVVGGRDFLEYVHPDDRERVNSALDKSLSEHVPYVTEYRFQHADGHEIIISEHAETEYGANGEPLRIRGTAQDITDRKRIEQELARLNAELEQRVEERTAELRTAQGELVKSERLATLGQLTATVSHELRNPLGTMRTSMYVVEKKTDADDQRLQAAIDRVNRNITRCDQIIDELLDYTRIRDLNLQETGIDNWLGAVLGEQTIPEGITVKQKFGIPDLRIPTDSDRLRRAFINVFENACQAAATPPKESKTRHRPLVTVETRLRGDKLEILIADNGPGIPAEVRDKIFEPLFSTKTFGVGLGLPTVKQIMEQHGGGVEISKRRGGGAKFALWLPLGMEQEIADK